MPGPPLQLKIRLLGGILHNLFTGYHADPTPTSEKRTRERQENQVAACQRLLEILVGPGDLLDADFRASYAREAYIGAYDTKAASRQEVVCLRDPEDFARYNREEAPHAYVTDHPFRDVAHAIVNHQDKLNKTFFESVVLRLKQHFEEKKKKKNDKQEETNGHSNDKNADDLDDYRVMAVELGVIAACCAGIRTYCDAAGIDVFPFPEASSPENKAYFSTVSDYAIGPLHTDENVAWGPFLTAEQFRPEVVARFHFDPFVVKYCTSPGAPPSKASPAPTTCMAMIFHLMVVMYTPIRDLVKFFGVPGKDRHLTRAQLEMVSAAYSRAVHCAF